MKRIEIKQMFMNLMQIINKHKDATNKEFALFLIENEDYLKDVVDKFDKVRTPLSIEDQNEFNLFLTEQKKLMTSYSKDPPKSANGSVYFNIPKEKVDEYTEKYNELIVKYNRVIEIVNKEDSVMNEFYDKEYDSEFKIKKIKKTNLPDQLTYIDIKLLNKFLED